MNGIIMKNLINIVLAAAIVAAAASCTGDEYTGRASSVSVTSARTSLEAAGDTADIVISSETPVTARANDGWLCVSVQGDVVTVAAPQNSDVSSRSTTVVITNGRDSAIVNVSQYGAIFSIGTGSYIYSKDAGMTGAYAMKANLPVDISTDCDWISLERTEDSISVTTATNQTGNPRVGHIFYHSGAKRDSVKVVQCDAEDLAGTWTVESMRFDGDGNLISQTGSVTLTPDVTGTTLTMTVSTGIAMELAFDSGRLVVKGGQDAGTFTSGKKTYQLASVIIDAGTEDITWDSDVTTTAELDSDGNFTFYSDSSWDGYSSDSFGIGAFSSASFSSSTWVGVLKFFVNPVLHR